MTNVIPKPLRTRFYLTDKGSMVVLADGSDKRKDSLDYILFSVNFDSSYKISQDDSDHIPVVVLSKLLYDKQFMDKEILGKFSINTDDKDPSMVPTVYLDTSEKAVKEMAENLVLEKDVTAHVLSKMADLKTNLVFMEDVDHKHFKNLFNISLPKENNTGVSLQKRDYDSKTYFKNLSDLGVTDLDKYKPRIDDITYDIVKETPMFKKLIKYLTHKNPMQKQANIILTGPASSGKTTMALAVARYLGEGSEYGCVPFGTITFTSDTDSESFAGSIVPIDGGDSASMRWSVIKNPVYYIGRAGGVLLIEEADQATHELQIACVNPFVDNTRRFRVGNTNYSVHDDCVVIASYNENYLGNKPLNEANKSRYKLFKIESIPVKDKVKALTKHYSHITVPDAKKFFNTMKELEKSIVNTFNEFNTDTSGDLFISFREEIQIAYDIMLNSSREAIYDYVHGKLSNDNYPSDGKKGFAETFYKDYMQNFDYSSFKVKEDNITISSNDVYFSGGVTTLSTPIKKEMDIEDTDRKEEENKIKVEGLNADRLKDLGKW